MIQNIVEHDKEHAHIPDYGVQMDEDMITFTNRGTMLEDQQTASVPSFASVRVSPETLAEARQVQAQAAGILHRADRQQSGSRPDGLEQGGLEAALAGLWPVRQCAQQRSAMARQAFQVAVIDRQPVTGHQIIDLGPRFQPGDALYLPPEQRIRLRPPPLVGDVQGQRHQVAPVRDPQLAIALLGILDDQAKVPVGLGSYAQQQAQQQAERQPATPPARVKQVGMK